MSAPTDVVVAVPARDEASGVAATLRSLVVSLDRARAVGLVDRDAVELVAHRCVDRTSAVARQVLAGRAHAHVSLDEASVTVGEVRDGAVRRALRRLEATPARTWVLSTDGDTVVGPDWVTSILLAADRASAVAVVGLAPLDEWRGGPGGAASYARLLRAGMRGGDDADQHDHVYGANLAVRADAYLDAGGFPRSVHGEDRALVDALARRGWPLLRTRAITVTTSGRLRGRATGGLADRLALLDAQADGRPGAGPVRARRHPPEPDGRRAG